MSTNTPDHVERSVVLWHLLGCMATFYTQHHPKESNKRKPYRTVECTGVLHCSHENLKMFTIAAPIRYFDHLTTIHLEGNQLTWLPRELWHLPNLQKLNLGRNALTALPASLGFLVGLKELYVHENQLETLPRQIGQLVDLRVLDVTNNTAMTVLPWEITQLSSSLRRLWIDGTQLVTPTTTTTTMLQQDEGHIPSLFHLCAQRLAGPPQTTTTPLDDTTGLPLSLLSSLMMVMDPANDLTTTTTTATTTTTTRTKNGNDDDDGRTRMENSPLMCRCSLCQTILYYPGIPLLELHGELAGQTLPLLYHVCSQTCRTRWLNRMKQGTQP